MSTPNPIVHWVSAGVGAGLGVYLGMSFFLPASILMVALVAMKRLEWRSDADRIVAAALLAQIVWMSLGAALLQAWEMVAIDLVLTIPLLVAFMAKPALPTAILIIGYEIFAASVNGTGLMEGVADAQFKGRVGALCLQLFIAAMSVGWIWKRKAGGSATGEVVVSE